MPTSPFDLDRSVEARAESSRAEGRDVNERVGLMLWERSVEAPAQRCRAGIAFRKLATASHRPGAGECSPVAVIPTRPPVGLALPGVREEHLDAGEGSPPCRGPGRVFLGELPGYPALAATTQTLAFGDQTGVSFRVPSTQASRRSSRSFRRVR